MGPNRWVVNASPLILLGKPGYLALLAAMVDNCVVPQAVATEVGAKPDGSAILVELNRHPTFSVTALESAPAEILAWDLLGMGETQVITYALNHGADRVVIDDLVARRCAQAMGLKVIGTLGVVGRAKAKGQIPLAAPIIEHLRRTGLYALDELVQRLLREVGK